MDPTGEIANILIGGGLGGTFGFAGGFLSSAISQALGGEKVDWKKALGSGVNGAITGAVQGGLLASGAGIPMALAANFAAGTAGSAAEQYIGTGKVNVRKSVTSGLTNAVSNLIYGTSPLGSAKEAFARGFGAGAATSGINYLSDLFDNRQPVTGSADAGGMSGITRGAVSPYGMQRDPRRGCGSVSPFTTSIGYSSAKGYQYSVPEVENVSPSRKKGFSLKDFAVQTIMGGVIGGVASAGFYGAGKGIEKLKESFRAGKGGETSNTPLSLQQALKELDASGLRPGQTELHMNQLNDVLDGIQNNYNPTKAYSSVYFDGTNRYLVEGHHTTVAFKMLKKDNAINMNTTTNDLPSATNVYWNKKWYQFWKKVIKIIKE